MGCTQQTRRGAQPYTAAGAGAGAVAAAAAVCRQVKTCLVIAVLTRRRARLL